jgi:hypothetical protein
VLRRAAALIAEACLGVIDEHAPHHGGGHAQEVKAALPMAGVLVHHAHERFVNQSGGLQRMLEALAFEVPAGDATQFVVHEGHQRIERLAVTVVQFAQKPRDFV